MPASRHTEAAGGRNNRPIELKQVGPNVKTAISHSMKTFGSEGALAAAFCAAPCPGGRQGDQLWRMPDTWLMSFNCLMNPRRIGILPHSCACHRNPATARLRGERTLSRSTQSLSRPRTWAHWIPVTSTGIREASVVRTNSCAGAKPRANVFVFPVRMTRGAIQVGQRP